jgi:hypothetical protein
VDVQWTLDTIICTELLSGRLVLDDVTHISLCFVRYHPVLISRASETKDLLANGPESPCVDQKKN